MSTNIEWARAKAPVFIDGDQHLADGNTPNENGRTDYIGIAWDQIVLYGPRTEVLKALADAALLVAQHMHDND